MAEEVVIQAPVLVLHIEDDPVVRASVASLLRAEGHTVLSAADGPSALELVVSQHVQPDVLIVDFDLPGEMDGSEAAEAISGALRRTIPTVLLTGVLTQAALPWMPAAPLFCAWKPFAPEVLLKVVESFADLGRFVRSHIAGTQ